MLSRRELVTVPLGLLGVTAGLVALRRSWSARARSLSDVAALYWRIAGAYARFAPAENDERILLDRLFGELDEPSFSEMVDAARRATQRDFDAGDTFLAEGWVLARTEGRLSLLAALQAGLDPLGAGEPGASHDPDATP